MYHGPLQNSKEENYMDPIKMSATLDDSIVHLDQIAATLEMVLNDGSGVLLVKGIVALSVEHCRSSVSENLGVAQIFRNGRIPAVIYLFRLNSTGKTKGAQPKLCAFGFFSSGVGNCWLGSNKALLVYFPVIEVNF